MGRRVRLAGVERSGEPQLENAAGLLERAVHATRRQVEAIVAEVAPRPDAPSSIRKLPAPRPVAAGEVRPAGPVAPDEPIEVRPAGPVRRAADRAVVVPIAPARFRVQFTASAELEEKIVRARALLRHKIPSGDLAAIVDEAMTLLVARLERRRCAATDRPRKGAPSVPDSREVSAADRRAVWARDVGRCTFVDREGRRCEAREWLEIHHDEPFGRGGPTCVENLRLLCRVHNAYQAEREFGAALVAGRIAEKRGAGGGGGQLALPGAE